MQRSFNTQPQLFQYSSGFDHDALHELDSVEAVLDWQKLEALMSDKVYASETGCPSYPLLTLLRAHLLGFWYKMSVKQLSNALARDLLFRRFCRLELHDGVPSPRTLGRFLDELVSFELWELLLGEVNRQLEEQQIIMTEGRINIVDATPIEALRSQPGKSKSKANPGQDTRDPDADYHVKANSRGKKTSIYGYSLHVGCDEDGFIHRQSMTPGNAHDSTQLDTLLLGDEAALYADPAYSSQATRDKLETFGIQDCVMRKGYRDNPISETNKERNAEISVVRSGGERPFAGIKKDFGLARTRFLGLKKNETFYGLAAIAANIKKAGKFLKQFGLRAS